ncbi:hypothetical protein GCM10027346_20290 [Hymenobacter seoulensis]
MRLSFLSLCVAALGLLSSCEDKNQESPLPGTRWMLEKVEDFPILASSYSGAHSSYIEFDAATSKTTGQAPCNTYSGTFTLGPAGRLTISEQATTKLTCGGQSLEDHYLEVLPRTVSYEISGRELRLYDATNSLKPILVFKDAD